MNVYAYNYSCRWVSRVFEILKRELTARWKHLQGIKFVVIAFSLLLFFFVRIIIPFDFFFTYIFFIYILKQKSLAIWILKCIIFSYLIKKDQKMISSRTAKIYNERDECRSRKIMENVFSINKDLGWKDLILFLLLLKQDAANFSRWTLQVLTAKMPQYYSLISS